MRWAGTIAMFDVGWTEMLVIAIVMIVVVGPKDLPKMLRTFGKTTAKLRAMAGDFQKQFNEALKEAELDDVKKSVESLRSLNPAAEIKKQLNPFEKAAADVRAGLDSAMNPTPTPAEPAASVAQASEPLKNGATVMPGAAEAEAKPAVPVAAAAPAPAAKADPALAMAAAVKASVARSEKSADAKPGKAAPKKSPAAAKPAAATKPAATKAAAAKAAAPKPAAAKKKPAGPAS
jgi:sec-independent protein translocase protein TatB